MASDQGNRVCDTVSLAFVCVHGCMYVCVCTCMCMCVHVHVCVYILCVYVQCHVHVCVCACVCVRVYVHNIVCTFLYLSTLAEIISVNSSVLKPGEMEVIAAEFEDCSIPW